MSKKHGKGYQLPFSKSDDLLFVHGVDQEKQLKLRESQLRKSTLHDCIIQMPKEQQNRRNSHNSITFKDENKKVKLLFNDNFFNDIYFLNCSQTKKKILTQIAQYGFNAYMAEYIIEKQNISLEQDYQVLLDSVIDKIHQFEEQYKSSFGLKIKKISNNQIVPIQIDEQPQIDQFIVEETRYRQYNQFKQIKQQQQLQEIDSKGKDQDKMNDCGICLGEYQDKEKALNCRHEFCKLCLQNYLDNKINNGQVLEIECPQQKCDNYFNDEAIKKLINDEQYRQENYNIYNNIYKYIYNYNIYKYIYNYNIYIKYIIQKQNRQLRFKIKKID